MQVHACQLHFIVIVIILVVVIVIIIINVVVVFLKGLLIKIKVLKVSTAPRVKM